MEPTIAPEAEPELELRVLEGAQEGARAPLTAGMGCVIAVDGDGGDADIVLRGDAPAPTRVRVTGALPHSLLEVLHGEVSLDGERLAAGAQVAWAMHAPLRIGSSVVAFGRVGEEPVE